MQVPALMPQGIREQRPQRIEARPALPPRVALPVNRLKGMVPAVRTRIHLDECMSKALAVWLRRRGLTVTTTSEAGLRTATDHQQLAYCRAERALLLTHDKDFLELHAEGVPHAGILVVPRGGNWHQEVVRVCLGF